MGIPGLCNFVSPLMEGADGFRFIYFHLLSFGISDLVCFIVFLISVWFYVGGVFGGSYEVVAMKEVLYLGFVLLCRENNYGVTFISSGYHGVVILRFGSD
jgi:hypothetical protein